MLFQTYIYNSYWCKVISIIASSDHEEINMLL